MQTPLSRQIILPPIRAGDSTPKLPLDLFTKRKMFSSVRGAALAYSSYNRTLQVATWIGACLLPSGRCCCGCVACSNEVAAANDSSRRARFFPLLSFLESALSQRGGITWVRGNRLPSLPTSCQFILARQSLLAAVGCYTACKY